MGSRDVAVAQCDNKCHTLLSGDDLPGRYDKSHFMKKKPLSKALEEIASGDVAYERVKDSYK